MGTAGQLCDWEGGHISDSIMRIRAQDTFFYSKNLKILGGGISRP